MKNLKIFKRSAIIAIAVLGFTTCQKFDEVPPDGKSSGTPKLTTLNADSITTKSVYCGGNITADGGNTISVRGLCWDTIENPTVEKNKTVKGLGIGEFKTTITGLNHNTTYYLKAYVVNTSGVFYGNQITFKTLDLTLPVVVTLNLSNITSTTATCESKIDYDGGSNITARGVCWSTTENPVASGSHTTNGTGTGNFTSNITGLTHGTTYFVRAYAKNSTGTSYGSNLSFTAGVGITLPILTTANITDITATTAVCGGNITNDGNSNIIEKGVCWSTSTNPTISNSHTVNGTGTGSFISNLSGLVGGTTYYVRAYATNSAGTSYGDEKYFISSAIPPTITTTSISSITTTTATSGGNVISDGGATVTARGVCWSTSQNPVATDSHTINGSGTGSFTSSITGLTLGATYYVRAYATNSAGTSYGAQLSFSTSANLPTITTSTANSITQTTATSGGNITSDGGAAITARGVCWSTSQNPAVSGSHTSNGAGTGSFTSSITGLTANTTYYVRAYATNSVGTAYGSQVVFNSLALPLCESFTDSRDGNYYEVVQIGEQCWMAKNLAYLPQVVGPSTESTTTPYYYVYGYEGTSIATAISTSNYLTYGVLYNRAAAISACPTGWHTPSHDEWTQLIDYLGGESVAGGKLKEVGTNHWNNPNIGATNSSGFNALPAGYRMYGSFSGIRSYAHFWSSSVDEWNLTLYNNMTTADGGGTPPLQGSSVRCLRD